MSNMTRRIANERVAHAYVLRQAKAKAYTAKRRAMRSNYQNRINGESRESVQEWVAFICAECRGRPDGKERARKMVLNAPPCQRAEIAAGLPL